MTSPGDWVISPQNVSAPPFLDLNSAGIVLGPDVPPCMSAFYSAVFRFQPAGAATGGLNAPPSFYIGQVLSTSPAGNERVDFGALIYDGLTVCGWRAIATWQIQNRLDGLGTLWPAFQFGGFNATSPAPLPAFFRDELNIGDTSGPVAPPVTQFNINKGDPLTRQPDPRNTPFTIDSVSAPRTMLDRIDSNTNTAGVVAETVVLTGNTKVFYPSRAFKVIVSNDALPLGAAGSCILSVRRNNVAGTQLAVTSDPLPSLTSATREHWEFVIRNATGGAAITDKLVVTLASGTANQVRHQGTALQLRYMEIWDCGDETLYPNCPQL